MAPRAGLPIWIAVIAALLLNTDVILGDLSTSPFDEVFSRVLDRFCAVKRDGAIACFGVTAFQNEPLSPILQGYGPFVQVSAGVDEPDLTATALVVAGLQYDGTIVLHDGGHRTVTVLSQGGPFVQLVTVVPVDLSHERSAYVCGLNGDGAVKCTDPNLQLSATRTYNQLVSASEEIVCALGTDGVPSCYVAPSFRALPAIAQFSNSSVAYSQICASMSNLCGLNKDRNQVECFGLKPVDGPRSAPLPPGVLARGVTIKQIACANRLLDGMCAVLSNGTAICWGSFVSLTVHPLAEPRPIFVVSTPSVMPIAAVSIGSPVSSALSVVLALLNGTLLNWQISAVFDPGNPVPVRAEGVFSRDLFAEDRVTDLVLPLTSVSAHGSYLCGLTVNSTIQCRFKRDGPSVTLQSSPFSGKQFRKVVTAYSLTAYSSGCICGIGLDDYVTCWGDAGCDVPGVLGSGTRALQYRDVVSITGTDQTFPFPCLAGLTDTGIHLSSYQPCWASSGSPDFSVLPFNQGHTFVQLSMYRFAACLRTNLNQVYCIGWSPAAGSTYNIFATPPLYLDIQISTFSPNLWFAAIRPDFVVVHLLIIPPTTGRTEASVTETPTNVSSASSLSVGGKIACALSNSKTEVSCFQMNGPASAYQLFPTCFSPVGDLSPCYLSVSVAPYLSNAEQAPYSVCATLATGRALCLSTPLKFDSTKPGGGLRDSTSLWYQTQFDYAVASQSRWIVNLGDARAQDLPFCGQVDSMPPCRSLLNAVSLYGFGPTDVLLRPRAQINDSCGLVLGASRDDPALVTGQVAISPSPLGLTIQTAAFASGAPLPELSCNGSNRFAWLKRGTRLTVRGVTIDGGNGGGGNGGAFVVMEGSTLVLEAVTIQNSQTRLAGGAMSVQSAKLVASNVSFINCVAGTMGGAIHSTSSVIIMTSATFVNNTVTPPNGAVWPENLFGGGIALISSEFVGAEISLQQNSVATHTSMSGPFSYGGAMYGFGSTIMASGWSCVGNRAARGGCVALQGLTQYTRDAFGLLVVGMFTVNPSVIHRAVRPLWQDNQAIGGYGGALFAENYDSILLFSSLFQNNLAFNGGGAVYIAGSQLSSIDTVLYSNVAPAGAGLYWVYDNMLAISNPYWNVTIANQNSVPLSYGPIQATDARGILFSGAFPIPSQTPGFVVAPALTVAISDFFSQTVYTDSQTFVQAGPLHLLSGTTAVRVAVGVATFENLVIHAPPLTSVELRFSVVFGNSHSELTVTVLMDLCPNGSVWDDSVGLCSACDPGRFANGSGESFTCIDCEPGSFSNASGSTTCYPCAPGTSAGLSGSKLCLPCAAGSYQPQSAQHACSPCPPGKEQPSAGLTECQECVAGRYAAFNGTVQCQACVAGRFSNPSRTDCRSCSPGEGLLGQECVACEPGWYSTGAGNPCEPCPAGSVSNATGSGVCTPCGLGMFQGAPGQQSCNSCPVGRYAGSPGSYMCTSCEQSGYTLSEGSLHCISCVGAVGMHCDAGIAIIDEDFWPYLELVDRTDGGIRTVQDELLTSRCELNRCPGGPFTGNASSTFRCGVHRPAAVNNVLCASCDDGYLGLESGECVKCSANLYVPLTLAVLALCWMAIMLLHKLAQHTGGNTKTLLYFVSTALLLAGPSRSWLRWLLPLNGAVSSSVLPLCAIPLGTSAALALDLLLCCTGWVLLWLTAVVHWSWLRWKRRGGGGGGDASELSSLSQDHEEDQLQSLPDSQESDVAPSFRLNDFQPDASKHQALLSSPPAPAHSSFWRPYQRTSLGLLIFTSSHVVSTLSRLVHCVSVQGRSVLLSAPSVDCDSSSYLVWAWLFWLLLVTVTAGLPVALALRLRSAHRNRLLMVNAQFTQVWGIFFESYKPKMYWFESLLLIRRSSIVLVAVMLWRYSLYRAVVLSLLCLLWLTLHFFLKPHHSTAANRFESLALFDLGVLSSLQVLQAAPGERIGSDQTTAIDVVTSLLIIPPTFAMVLYILRRPVASMGRKVKRLVTHGTIFAPAAPSTKTDNTASPSGVKHYVALDSFGDSGGSSQFGLETQRADFEMMERS